MQFSAWPQQLLAEHIPFLQGKSQVKNWWWGGSRLGPSGLKSNQLNKATQLEDQTWTLNLSLLQFYASSTCYSAKAFFFFL